MTWLHRAAALWRNLFRRQERERALDEELQGYVDAITREGIRAGMARDDAERAARLEVGGVEQVKELARDARTGAAFDALLRDVRYAMRALRRTPTFTIAAIIALALGIGATTAIVSVVRGVLLQPLHYADAGRLVVALHDGHNPVAPANFLDWRAQTHSFTDMAATELWSPALTGDADPEELSGLRMTSGMLPLLGVQPLLGRMFAADEDQPGNEQVVILSYGLWQRRFAGARDVVGRSVLLDGKQYTIIGVMPESFHFAPFWATHAELWAPLAFGKDASSRASQSLRIFARLRPGVTLAGARADLGTVTARLEREFPGTNQNVQLRPLAQMVVGDIETPLIVLLAAVGFVLLIACANVAHMLLARAAARQRELAVRTALGATRRRIVAQLLVESSLLALGGGVGGLMIGAWGVHALVAAAPSIIPRVSIVRIDVGVLLAMIAVTAGTTLAFGLFPALRAARVDLAETFRDGSRSSSDGRESGRTRNLLVASEFTLALVLLVGAGLMIRSVVALEHVDPGLDPRNVVSMIVSTTGTPAADSSRHQYFYIDALERVKALPGIVTASYINHRPFDGDMWGFQFRVEGRPHPKPGEWPKATYRVVFPGYFATMRIPILRGRDIEVADRMNTPKVVVIDEYTARRYWPGEDAIGKRLTFDDSTWVTVVGVVQNEVRDRLASPPAEEIFLPFFQERGYVNGIGARRAMTLVARVRCEGAECDPAAAVQPIRAAIRSVERNAPISGVVTLTSLMAEDTAEPRFYLVLLGAFATVAIVLAAVGVYGVMSYSVARRTREIGIRIALGARPASVVRSVVARGLIVAAGGATAGIVAAFGMTRLMRSILFGVSPTDAATFGAVTLVLLVVAVAASVAPALRATRVDPLTALRSD
ncbi:MAG TPA: ABC transporter permease [Gemmatimonadaceae bacterium]|jgi:putative ABC transport system permease protein